ncbi:hypothetical protein YC2023_011200 [Brassica napus]
MFFYGTILQLVRHSVSLRQNPPALFFLLRRSLPTTDVVHFVSNTPPRDHGSLRVNLGMFGQGSMGQIYGSGWTSWIGL